ncbi:hypothetical protein AVEN_168013-1 [Araneus ventricosus]|uniref:Uncharacterized protein n=1 Tax=Araneus ventricosus TaxID=182803 RepID=A0A4Y2JU86_ARAVE|nr:hypothetical protein AVEN_168013-1 [Araneus ventricosus]
MKDVISSTLEYLYIIIGTFDGILLGRRVSLKPLWISFLCLKQNVWRSRTATINELRAKYQGHGSLVLRSRLQGRKVPGSKPVSTEEPPCTGPYSYIAAVLSYTSERPHVLSDVVRKFGEVSSSSSDEVRPK